MFKVAVVLLALCFSTSLTIPNFRACQDGGSVPITFEINGCPETPCLFKEGEEYHATAFLRAPSGTNTITVLLLGFLNPKPIRFPLSPEQVDGCGNIFGASWPVAGGDEFVYNLTVPINGQAKGNLVLEHVFKADRPAPWICVQFGIIFF